MAELRPVRWVRQVISEMIGRVNRTINWRWRDRLFQSSEDTTKADYAWHDKARRGGADGLEIAGLFLKPLASKAAAWVMGKVPAFDAVPPSANGMGAVDEAQEAMQKWWGGHHADILMAYEEALSLGDSYIVVNPDLSLAVMSPDLVQALVAEDDFSAITGWRISQRFDHPTEIGRWMDEVNEYTAAERVRRVAFNGGNDRETTYPNLAGALPVIKISNNVGINERYGRPEGEALVVKRKSVLQRYEQVMQAAIDGNIRLGRSNPVFKFPDVEALDKFLDEFGRRKKDDKGEEYWEIDFSSDQVVATIGDFKWESPGSFTGDTERLLGLLFYMMLQHTEIPEFIWGNAIQGSKASAETQMPPFVRFIDKKRGQAGKWIKELCNVVNAFQALTMTRVARIEDWTIGWDSLTGEEGQLTLAVVQWALAEGLIDRETALMLAPVDIENIPDVLAKADEENQVDQQTQNELDYEQAFNALKNSMANPTPDLSPNIGRRIDNAAAAQAA